MDLVEDLLVVGIGVDRGHQAAFDPDRIVQHLCDRRQAVGGARRVGDDRVPGLQLVVVDAVHDGQVDALGGCRDQHLLRARIDMLLRAFAIGEEAGAFQHQFDAVFGVGQLGGIALGSDLDPLTVDDQVIALCRDFTRIAAMHAVAAEQPGVRLGVRQVVDGDEFQPAIGPFEDRARHQTTDASEPVDCNLGHPNPPFVIPANAGIWCRMTRR